MRRLNLTFNLLRYIFTFILTMSVLFAGLPPAARAQTKRVASKTAKVSQKKSAADEQNTSSAQTVFSEPVNSVMSQSWQSGQLPAPLPLPAGNTDEVAAILAQKVAAKNQESVPALLTALQLSGFSVTDKKGVISLTPPDGKGQGLLINGWEVASVARMYGDNRTVNLIQLDQQLQSVPILRALPAQGENIASILIEGISKQADNTSNPFLRVWARFIIELGKNSAGKYDLKGGAKAGQINLDAIQHLLIMRRLYGDFWATAQKVKTQDFKAEADGSKLGVSNSAGFQIVKASFDKQTPQNLNDFSQSDDKKTRRLCEMTGDAPTIFDAIATSLGMAWDNRLEAGSESTDADIKKYSSKYAAFMTVANILLVYAKFIQTYASLETTITAEDGDAPLVRTKNKLRGARKKLRASVRLNIGNWEKYNCLRASMNVMTGIDFSTLNDGPLGGVGVQWGLTEGGDGDYYSNADGINKEDEQIVGFTADNPKRIQDKGVGAGRGLGNLTFNKTDDKGETEIILEGTPQRNAKLGKLNQVRKQARVTTAIEIKAGEIKGDMVDVYGQWADGLPGLISMPAELLYRTSWAASGALNVPVIDWEECTGDWAGTITYTRTNKFNESNTGKLPSARGESTVTRNMNDSYSAKINFNGAAAEAFVFADSVYSETRDTWEMNGCRNNEPMRRMSCNISRKSQTTATGSGKAAVRISVNRAAETYGLSFSMPGVPGYINTEEKGTCSGQCVPLYVKPYNYKGPGTLEGKGFTVPEQKLAASNALTITGSYSKEIEPNVTVTVSWDLRQCGAQANVIRPATEEKQAANFYALQNIFEETGLEADQSDSLFSRGNFVNPFVSPLTD